MKPLLSTSRIILGILYFLFGLNGFLQFLPSIELPGIKAIHFFSSLEESEYILPMIHISSLVMGTSLLFNLFSAFFLLLFFPIAINFLFFFYFLGSQILFAPEMFFPIAINLIHLFLLLSHYKKYIHLFKED